MHTKIDLIEVLSNCKDNKAGYTITQNGEVIERPFDGEYYDIKKIKNDCNFDYIELVRLPGDIILIADEEGLLRSKEYNLLASIIYQEAYNNRNLGIVGDVVICHTSRVNQSIINLGLHYFQKNLKIFLEVFLQG